MKFYEMEEGKEYNCFYHNGNKSNYKHRINYGFVEYLGSNNVWKREDSSQIDIYNYDFKEIKREIDWDKVPRMTPVKVSDFEDGTWTKGNFVIFMKGNNNFPFACTDKEFHGISGWKYCEIISEIKDEWYK